VLLDNVISLLRASCTPALRKLLLLVTQNRQDAQRDGRQAGCEQNSVTESLIRKAMI
jgi:hypothetical protein